MWPIPHRTQQLAPQSRDGAQRADLAAVAESLDAIIAGPIHGKQRRCSA
jgi:hypothetical protein